MCYYRDTQNLLKLTFNAIIKMKKKKKPLKKKKETIKVTIIEIPVDYFNLTSNKMKK